ARHAEIQFAYEDRLAELRAQIDRFSSRQLIDQEAYEKKLEKFCAGKRHWSRAPARSTASATSPVRSGSRRAAAQAASHGRMCRSQRGTRELWSFRSIGAASHAPAYLPKARVASAARSSACWLPSIASSSARRRWSARWRRLTMRRRGAYAACWPSSGSI